MIDGFLARKWHAESRLGKFLDPFADKVLIIGALIGLIVQDKVIKSIAITLIARDVLMDIIRLIHYKHKEIPAIFVAKCKTLLQMVGVLVILIALMVGQSVGCS